MSILLQPEHVEILQGGGVGVVLTDTIYGVVGQALRPETVERIYRVKGRRPDKPFIILISSLEQIELFGIEVSEGLRERLITYWPGPVSVILPSADEGFRYLDRGSGGLAFRMPNVDWLRELIDQTGPLVAPSANPEGLEPAGTIAEAKAYFGDQVDFYADGGERRGKSSKLIRIVSDEIEILRP